MRVLIIGNGGREHTLAWKLRQSPLLQELFIAPGNGGTAEFGENCEVAPGDISGLIRLIQEKKIDFVVPGPELSLVHGITDACAKIGVPCFGPDAYAAQLEGSKVFSKTLMQEAGVPTAPFQMFTRYDEAAAYVDTQKRPLVIKADGLAAGKGVVVAQTSAEAKEALHSMLVEKIFGKAGETVLVEEALVGEEVSFLAFCDGETVIPLPSAQDHKAVFNDDAGPNTGGMGAYSPAPALPEQEYERMVALTMLPVLKILKERGHPFTGVLYAGLMMTADGPQVLEYNTRFGDPECQPLLMRLEGDLLAVMLAATRRQLHEVTLPISTQHALCVVIAAQGYPADYVKDIPILGIQEAEKTAPGNVKVFHAGTTVKNRKAVSSGGRILGVTATGVSLQEAQQRAYAAVSKITMPTIHYRTDIGDKGLRTTR